MNNSLYLSQSYQDAWSDYVRSLRNGSFPTWDYIFLTASNEHQASVFKHQISIRQSVLPPKTQVVIISDEGGVRVGSGGATLSVLKWLDEHGGWKDKRILVIHSGGDSKRVPQYSALGKLFSPVPHVLPDKRSSTLFDEFLITMSSVPGRIQEGMLLLSGDVLLLFNPLLIDWSGSGAAVISFKENVETGKEHGVYLRGEDGNVRSFLHKQSIELLKNVGAVNAAGDVDIDTGAILFGVDLLDALFRLISVSDSFDVHRYATLVNERVRLSLYGDFQYPLASDSTLEEFYTQGAEGDICEELKEARTLIWKALRPYRMKLLRIAPAKFLHFGTTKEILNLVIRDVEKYKDLGWNNQINCSMRMAAGYNSVVSSRATVADSSYLEVSYVHGESRVGGGSVLSYIDVYNKVIPGNVVVHGLKQINGKFVVRIFGVDDDPKCNKLFGKVLKGDLWDKGEPHILWTAKIYPEKDNIDEAVDAAIRIYKDVMNDEMLSASGKSIAAGFIDADSKAIIDWNDHMTELVQMNKVASMIENRIPIQEGDLKAPMTTVQREWLDRHTANADLYTRIRLHYYVGTALGDEEEAGKAFSSLSAAILEETARNLKENNRLKICKDVVEISLPLRVNWGGGWSDTPPYCNENGGTVLNAAITLNGVRPVSVRLRRIEERKIVFESRDMDVHGEFDSIEFLQSVGDPFDPYVLQKASLLACGVIPANGGSLYDVLDRLGGGIRMDTEVIGVPKGSGLGTSSILAAACVKGCFEFLGVKYTEYDLYSTVLCMEQIMSTGGGWQDQVGGVTDGIKYISSKPGLKQEIKVQHVALDSITLQELNNRFALIYTGQRRLARNLLRNVVGRYIGNEPENVYALNEIQKVAALMRFELERGNVDSFAELLNQHWELSKKIDNGSTNTLIDQIFDSIKDLLAGKMVCGAGGGGFLQVVLKKGVRKNQLQNRLNSVFSDTDIGVWDCELV